MKKITNRRMAAALGVAAMLVAAAVSRSQTAAPPPAAAEKPAVKRNVLMKQDTAVPGREAVMASVELPPGSREGRHTHFADVYGFVAEGTVVLTVEGQPERTFKAGEVFAIPQGKIHEGRNDSSAPARISAVFFAEKGKPLTTPAP
jgi:quercetin dioxygenase-like cupin family protein